MVVYIVQYSVNYETYLDGVFLDEFKAKQRLNELKNTNTDIWNSGEVLEREVN